ncbi:hypothetical protein [Gymnodinialimonas hymeniacidonis]|uniref:hypothetical protein n=1 Tax=Gymnodinialimonas hymeniacidonis TaxID=3126508 RepID=UPI0034C5E375
MKDMTNWDDRALRTANVVWSPAANSSRRELINELINEHAGLRLRYVEETKKVTDAYACIAKRHQRVGRVATSESGDCPVLVSNPVTPNGVEQAISSPQNMTLPQQIEKGEYAVDFSASTSRKSKPNRPSVANMGISENEFEQLELSELRIHSYLHQLEELETEIAGSTPNTPKGLIEKLRFFARLASEGSEFALEVLPFVLDASLDHLEEVLWLKGKGSDRS